VVKAAGA